MENLHLITHAAGNSNQGEPKGPKPKRQRIDPDTALVVQKKQSHGGLSGLMTMPVDIFTEVNNAVDNVKQNSNDSS